MTTQQEQAVADFLGEEVPAPVGEFPMKPGQQLASSVDGHPVGAKVTEVDRGRWILVYNTRTGVASKMNVVHRPFLDPANPRAWKWPDGTLQLSVTPPVGITPIKGEFMCLLHPDHPKRKHYDKIGLQGKTCFEDGGGKAGIPSEYEVGRHMGRHPREYAVILADEAKQEKLDDREWQRTLLLMARGEVPAGTPAVVETPSPVPVPQPETPSVNESFTSYTKNCSVCAEVFEGRNSAGAASKRRAHMRKEHPG